MIGPTAPTLADVEEARDRARVARYTLAADRGRGFELGARFVAAEVALDAIRAAADRLGYAEPAGVEYHTSYAFTFSTSTLAERDRILEAVVAAVGPAFGRAYTYDTELDRVSA